MSYVINLAIFFAFYFLMCNYIRITVFLLFFALKNWIYPNYCISLHSMMKTIKSKKATGILGKMVSEVNPVQLAKMRNRMLIAAKIADAMQVHHLNQKLFAKLMGSQNLYFFTIFTPK